jgi:hypothetical protein
LIEVREKPMTATTEVTEVSAPSAGAVIADRIFEISGGFRSAKVLFSAVELGVFTVLAAGPHDLDRLTAEIGISKRGARDFFDALVALRLIERDSSGRYRNTTEVDYYLDREKPTYIGDELDYFNLRGYPHWHLLTTALTTGKAQSEASAGDYFPSLYANSKSLEFFAKAMTAANILAGPAIAAKFPWHQYRTLLDVGTAQGCLPVQIAKAHPHIGGGGFDLPAMQPLFESYVRQHRLGHRLRFHAGDFLRDPLPAADVLVFGRVLHNWDLGTKNALLKKAYDALPAGGAVIVLERLIDDERNVGVGGLLASLHMLIMTDGGFDFSAADCTSWLLKAGFREPTVTPLTSTHSMVVGTK